ncbi:U2 small nuclear ribonucleoprotein auxiliary factor 35 kDa subunit-related protein 2-like [Polyodon spathula]|uniref:U2 small nuclear ribonucleoprotein auxiliary factor 35 kDa subunit-related protein 2-like n=1 Tax=Polyodon spathula TaxID=7913 RepID=UPI001B7E8359|nr:U2 small nuclear ribonucleoprotein auxiliary factor 35 kDa subunit-related protein 2-like [Polyodon spathula]
MLPKTTLPCKRSRCKSCLFSGRFHHTSLWLTLNPALTTIQTKMAASVVAQCNQKLGHKQFRAALKKEKRKKKRQAFAKLRDAELPEEEGEGDTLQDEELEEERRAEEERQRLHLQWMEKEKIAQEEFRLRREKEEAARLKREEEEWRIKEEWEEQQKKEQHEKEKKQQEKRDREEAVQKMLDQAESQLENGGTWHNPEAPVDYGTEKDRANCPFYLKTGACRFGDRCSRKHAHPASSPTLMIRGMFVSFGIEQSRRDDYDTDASLEYSEEEVHQQFLDFYEDVLPEFKSVGKVLQFKVSCNFEPHLRGNVYIQFQTDDECREAFMRFNGRYYAGRQLQCEFCPVTRWKTAICGLFDRQKCPRGKHCNFLHVYRNPDNQFWEADRDFHMSPDRSSQYSGRFSERYSERRGRSFQYSDYKSRRQHSCSPESSRRRNGESDRRAGNRSRSRERLRTQRSRSRSKERGNSRAERPRSKERRRSNSRERFSARRERRSKNRSRTRSKSRDKKRSKSPRESRKRTRNRSRSKSHSGSGDGDGRSCSKGGSPSQTEIRKARSRSRSSERIDCKSPRHKHSKKSKKKKQKKDKKKNRSPDKKQSPNSLKKHSEDDKNSPLNPVEKDCLMEEGTQQDVPSVGKNSGTVLESDPALGIPEKQQDEDNVHNVKPEGKHISQE